jgi:catechol 2,3-dioxygenase-like lactoylglutathione lyase family enzyme
MSFHHVALATADLASTHCFYTEAMGFTLAKVMVNPTPEGGWAKHVFYDTDDGFGAEGGLLAFWDLHGDYPPVQGAMSRSVGLPDWVNHLAFTAVDEPHLDAALERWLGLGVDAVEIDHEFCRSIYTNDPNGTLVEWCLDTRPLDEADRERAAAVLLHPDPDHDGLATGFRVHEARSERPEWMPPQVR